jgi:hypothetical protein
MTLTYAKASANKTFIVQASLMIRQNNFIVQATGEIKYWHGLTIFCVY